MRIHVGVTLRGKIVTAVKSRAREKRIPVAHALGELAALGACIDNYRHVGSGRPKKKGAK